MTAPRGWEVVRVGGEFSEPALAADDLLALADAVREAGPPPRAAPPSAADAAPRTHAGDARGQADAEAELRRRRGRAARTPAHPQGLLRSAAPSTLGWRACPPSQTSSRPTTYAESCRTSCRREVAQAIGAAFAEVVAIPDGVRGIVIGHDMRPSSPELSDGLRRRRDLARGRRHRSSVSARPTVSTTRAARSTCPAPCSPRATTRRSTTASSCAAPAARPVGQDSGLAEIRDLAQWMLDGGTGLAAPGRRPRRVDDPRPARRLRRLPARPRRPVRDRARSRSSSTPATAWAVTRSPPCSARAPGCPSCRSRSSRSTSSSTAPSRTTRPTRSTRPTSSTCRPPCASTAPTSASPSTATPTAASSSTPTASRCRRAPSPGSSRSARSPGPGPAATTDVVDRAQRHLERRGARDRRRGGRRDPVRTRVGHSFIKAEMARAGAVFGGEHSAHYYFRDFWFADTGMLAALHVLAALGEQDAPALRALRPSTSATSPRARSTRR